MKRAKLRPVHLNLWLLLLFPLTASASIYGNDDRVEAYDVTNPVYLQAAQATAAMIPMNHLSQAANGNYLVQAPSFGKLYNLCSTERFIEQPAAAGCSGFLIADDLVVTAGHCTQDRNICDDHVWAFGYRLNRPGQTSVEIPAKDIYRCKVIHEKFIFEKYIDYSILKLDRKVEGYQPVAFRQHGSPSPGTKLVLAGFPRGLPLKLAEGFVTRTTQDYLVTNVDAYTVNSGSLVFDAETGKAEGILSAGPFDFTDGPNGCSVSTHLEDQQAMTNVSRIRLILDLLK